MGRTASGVKGIELSENCFCVGAEIATPGQEVLVVTEKGYGKKTAVDEYRLTHRGSKGVKALNVTDKNGNPIPEGTVLVYSVAREAGVRSKVAVASTNPKVDPIGSWIGEKARRIAMVWVILTLFSAIAIGVVGMIMAFMNYPIYQGILGSRKKKYGAEILALSDKIMNQ